MILARTIVVLVCSVLLTIEAPAQERRVGIFITTPLSKDCPNKLKTMDRKEVCITQRPVIPRTDFLYITELVERTHANSYFHLVLSDSGFNKLKAISRDLPSAELVLVVDDAAVGFVRNLDRLKSGRLMIDAPEPYKLDLILIHQKFSELVTVRKR